MIFISIFNALIDDAHVEFPLSDYYATLSHVLGYRLMNETLNLSMNKELGLETCKRASFIHKLDKLDFMK